MNLPTRLSLSAKKSLDEMSPAKRVSAAKLIREIGESPRHFRSSLVVDEVQRLTRENATVIYRIEKNHVFVIHLFVR